MPMLLQGLASITGLAVLVFHIIVIVKMFQRGQTALGVVAIIATCCGIGPIVTLIMGWLRTREWDISTNLMLAYTITFVVYLVLFGLTYQQMMALLQAQ